MYVADTLERMNEEAVLEACVNLTDDDGSPLDCDHCDESATMGIPVYNPADALRVPPVEGVHHVVLLCEECRNSGNWNEELFYCEGCDDYFIINHSWDVVAVSTDDGYSCQKCAAEKLEGVMLERVVEELRIGETGLFTRINSVPGKEVFFEGEFAPYPDFPGHNTWEGLAGAVFHAARDSEIEDTDLVYPIIDHGYQFSVSLAIYY